MKLSDLQPGAVVRANKLGREFRARLTGSPAGGEIPVEPLDPHVTYRRLRRSEIRQVLEPDPAQLHLGART